MIKRYLVLFILVPLAALAGGHRNSSVLSTGTWYKINITQTGIHRITYADLVALGMDPASVNPADLRVYGNGGAMLPEMAGKPRVDDLRENPVLVVDGNDGTFDPIDYILFYGEAADRVRYNPDNKLFDHEKNIYSDKATYFITADLGPGKRIGTLPSSTLPANSYSTRFSDFAFHDLDLRNLIRSGRTWVGEEFNDTLSSHEFLFVFPHLDTSSGVRFSVSVAAKCQLVSYFFLYCNDSLVDQIPVDYTDPQSINIYARTKLKNSLFFDPKDTLRIRLDYPLLTTSAKGWLNYVEVNLQRRLVWTGPQMAFRDPNSIGPSKVTEFKIVSATPDVRVWEVTDPESIRLVEPIENDSVLKFRLPTESLQGVHRMGWNFVLSCRAGRTGGEPEPARFVARPAGDRDLPRFRSPGQRPGSFPQRPQRRFCPGGQDG